MSLPSTQPAVPIPDQGAPGRLRWGLLRQGLRSRLRDRVVL